jgi:DNA replication protein DnaC
MFKPSSLRRLINLIDLIDLIGRLIMYQVNNSSGLNELLREFKAMKERAALTVQKPFHDSSALKLSQLTDDQWEDAGAFLKIRPLPDCGRCSSGFLSVDRGESPTPPPARPCPHCEIPRRRFARVHHARLPVDARGVSLSSYEWDSETQQRAIQSAQAWLLSPRADRAPNVYLFGPPGNGKTTLLYGLAFAALDRGLKVRYATHARLFDDEKDSWRGETESPFKTWLDDVDLLLLDELGGLGGAGNWSAWWKERSREMLQAIHEKWNARKLAIVICSNMAPERTEAMFDSPSASSRLEMMFHSVEMTGHDRRRRSRR